VSEPFPPGDDRHPVGPLDRLLSAPPVLRATAGAALVALVVTFAFSGIGGIVLLLTAATVLGLLAAAAVVPGPPAARPRPVPAPPLANAPFRTYRQVAEQLSWAGVSPRHYDVVTRPLLQRLARSRLAERHGVDLDASPDAARALLGEDVWVWLDPRRPASSDSQPPGLDRRVLHRLVDRLEAL
jgi:hypothetical protein